MLEIIFGKLPRAIGYELAWAKMLPLMAKKAKAFLWLFALAAVIYYYRFFEHIAPFVNSRRRLEFSNQMMLDWAAYALIGLFAAPFIVWFLSTKNRIRNAENGNTLLGFTPESGMAAFLLTSFWLFAPYGLCMAYSTPPQSTADAKKIACPVEITNACRRVDAGATITEAFGTTNPEEIIAAAKACVACGIDGPRMQEMKKAAEALEKIREEVFRKQTR